MYCPPIWLKKSAVKLYYVRNAGSLPFQTQGCLIFSHSGNVKDEASIRFKQDTNIYVYRKRKVAFVLSNGSDINREKGGP